MDNVSKLLDVNILRSRMENMMSDAKLKPEHWITLGTMGTLYLLYKNYTYVSRIKEQRKSKSGNASVKSYLVSDRKSMNKDRNIFQKIWNLGGLFDSLEGLDRILDVLFIPSMEHGLRFQFGNVPSDLSKPRADWHYADVADKAETILKASRRDKGLPFPIYNLLKLARIFGYWFLEDILRLNDLVQYTKYKAGECIFKINEKDDKIYIILSGNIQLSFMAENGSNHNLRCFRSGDHLVSLISFIDYIIGTNRVFRVINAHVLEDSEVIVIPMSAIHEQLLTNDKLLSIGLQRALRRAYDVVFTACHLILGLSQELVADIPRMPIKTLDGIPVGEKPSLKLVEDVGDELLKVLGLPDRTLLAECSVMVVPPDFVLCEAGKDDNISVVFLYEGEIQVNLKSFLVDPPAPAEAPHFFVHAGEIFGSLAFLTEDTRLFTAKTSVKSIIVIIPGITLKNLMDNYPSIFFPLVNSIFRRLSSFTRRMDFGMEWTYFESGQAVFYNDDEPSCTYLVLSGRLRSYLPPSDDVVADAKSLVGEYGKYDFVGLPEMWTHRRRTKTVLAVRDTGVAKIPYDFLTYICNHYSRVSFQIIQYLTRKVVSTYRTRPEKPSEIFNMAELRVSKNDSISTMALFPTSPDVPIMFIAKEFARHYSQYGNMLIISTDTIKGHFGEDAFVPGAHSGLTAWLGYMESMYTKILYIAEPVTSFWSLKCFHQADKIFIVVNNDSCKELSQVEKMILEGRSLARKELLILHKHQEGFPKKMPRYTKHWLEKRPWLNFHHHVFISSKFYNLSAEKLKRLGPGHYGNNDDLARVVRWTTGNTFGLALGGGGAKGAAHIGFLREFQKTMMPIDMICGVSIGSFIGALLAVHQTLDSVEALARNWFAQTANPVKFLLDLTIPYVSLFKGDSLNCSLIELFGDVQIEDLRIPFFTCTTDLSNNSIREHRCGSLWRYVRASMTLINYFPPICDPKDGHYLIDGGYTNLVPADMMRKLGVRYIMAVDISSKANHYRNTNYGDTVSGLNLISHMTPVQSKVTVPSIFEIQSRLNWAQSVVYLKLVKKMEFMDPSENSPSVIYIRLPIDFYSTSDFKRFDKILEIGLNFGKRILENIEPGDPVDIVWLKLKANKGIHRFGSKMFYSKESLRSSFMFDPEDFAPFKSRRRSSGEDSTNISSSGTRSGSIDFSNYELEIFGRKIGETIN